MKGVAATKLSHCIARLDRPDANRAVHALLATPVNVGPGGAGERLDLRGRQTFREGRVSNHGHGVVTLQAADLSLPAQEVGILQLSQAPLGSPHAALDDPAANAHPKVGEGPRVAEEKPDACEVQVH